MMKKILSNVYIRYGLIAIAGIFIGWILFHSPKSRENTGQLSEQQEAETIWTCAMHPQIRMDHPGKCPICGMDLIPLRSESSVSVDPDAIKLTREAAELANVETSVVTRQRPVKEVRLYGKVQTDERLLQSQTAHMPGRIERLLVNFTGETVRKGQPLVIIYSPDLVTAQQELLEAAKMKQSQPEIYEAAKDKLRQWKLTDSQISDIENSGKVTENFEIYSNTDGVVTARRVNNGDHVDQGTVLFDVANLSDVWVMFDAYESDLPFLKTGDNLSFSVQALPGSNFTGRITFIDPVIDPVTRVAKVRVEIGNSAGKLKPEMFVTGVVNADLGQYSNRLIIPRSAVLWTGVRSIVYVKQADTDEPVFKMRQIELGPSLGNSYVVLTGLNEGEKVVTNGTYSVDASAQLEGKPSMMNPQGGKVNTMPGMDMPGMDMPENQGKDADVSGGSQTTEKSMSTMNTKEQQEQNISMDFIMQLGTVYDKYIGLKNALVKSDGREAGKESEMLKQALDKVDMNLLSGDSHMKWMEMLNAMNEAVNKIAAAGDLNDQRLAFSTLSDQLYKAVKTFGLMSKTVYYQFCPMFNNSKGAYWLSEIKEIKNPYYGSEMISCGDTKEILK
jgi:Cu(I)/Ag(I) efflux system membrane fusion protein